MHSLIMILQENINSITIIDYDNQEGQDPSDEFPPL